MCVEVKAEVAPFPFMLPWDVSRARWPTRCATAACLLAFLVACWTEVHVLWQRQAGKGMYWLLVKPGALAARIALLVERCAPALECMHGNLYGSLWMC
jgi:hypothetical protein